MRTKHKIFGVLMVLVIVAALFVVVAPTASAAVTSVTWTPSPLTAGVAASQSVAVTIDVSLTAGSDSIAITFPTGVTVPTSIAKEYIGDNAGTAHPSLDATVSGQVVSFICPNSVTAPTTVTYTISQVAGVKNPSIPSASGYIVYVSIDGATAVASVAVAGAVVTYYPDPTISYSPTTGATGTAVTVTGTGFTPGTSVTLSSTGGVMSLTPGIVSSDGTISMTGVSTGYALAVTATDGAGISATSTTTFTPKATVAVSPTSGIAGSTATVTVSGLTSLHYYALSLGSSTTTASAASTYPNLLTMDSCSVAGTAGLTALFPANTPVSTTYGPIYGAEASTAGMITCVVTIPSTVSSGVAILYVKDGGTSGTSFGGTNTALATTTAFNAATIAGQTTFTVSGATVTVSPTSGPIGTTVTITGANFPPTKSATSILFDAAGVASAMGITLSSVVTDGGGAFSVSGVIPASGSGITTGLKTYAIYVNVDGTVAYGGFTVTAGTVVCSPTSGPRGSSVIVTANGLTLSGTVLAANIKISNAAWSGAPTSTAIDSAGSLTPITLTVPTTAILGADTVSISDGSLTATGTFTVTQPTITLSASSGPRGQALTVTGAEWLAGSVGIVQVQMTGVVTAGVYATVATATPDANGEFSASVTIPTSFTAGLTYLVKAIDSYGNVSAASNFTVSSASISCSPTSAAVASTVTVTGVGFLPYSGVSTITIGGANVIGTVTLVTDSVGTFTVTVTVPGVAVGGRAVVATSGSETASTSITVTAAAVSAPTVANGLAAISGEYDQVWTLTSGTWQLYDPASPSTAEFTSLTSGMAIFINMTADVSDVTIGGVVRNLVVGWNNVGIVS